MNEKILESVRFKMREKIRQSDRQFFNVWERDLVTKMLDGAEYKIDLRIQKQEALMNQYGIPNKLSEVWNTVGMDLPDFDVTARCKEELVKELQGTHKVSTILNIWRARLFQLSEDHYNGYLNEGNLMEIAEFNGSVLSMLQEIYRCVNDNDFALKWELGDLWDRSLTRLNTGVHNKFGIVVSMSVDDPSRLKYPIISCAYVTEAHNKLYTLSNDKDRNTCRRIGWYFRPSMNDVIGMSPYDANSAVISPDNTENELKFAIQNYHWLQQNNWLYGVNPDFQACYTPKDMCASKDYNEIILAGTTKPDGVFLISFGDYTEDIYYQRAKCLARERGLPLIIYHYMENVIEQVW